MSISITPYEGSALLRFPALQALDGPKAARSNEHAFLAPADALRQAAEIILTKDIIKDDSPWDVRLQTYAESIRDVPEVTADPAAITNNYESHLGSATSDRLRVFEADRAMPHQSMSGAPRLRLQVTAAPDRPNTQYDYTVTAYHPLPVEEARTPYDHEEYEEALRHIAAGTFEAWVAQKETEQSLADAAPKPLPALGHLGINSQLILKGGSRPLKGQALRVATLHRLTAHQRLVQEHGSREALARYQTWGLLRDLVTA